MDAFMDDIELIYQNELIYRAMVICTESNKQIMKTVFEQNGHTVLCMDSIDPFGDYESIDARVMLVSSDLFKDVINHFETKYGLDNISYNLFAFSYDLDEDISSDLKDWYKQKNKRNIIII